MPHTPGPWSATRMLIPSKAKDRRSGFVVNGPDRERDDLPTRICDLRAPRGVDGFSEAESNARLIAAAPAMLFALGAIGRDCVEVLEGREPLSMELIHAIVSRIAQATRTS